MAKRKEGTQKKEKKIYFSPEIDSRIEGFALVFTFVVIGLVLQFFPGYFGNQIVTEIVKWVFIVVGIIGFASELGKQKNRILGLDNLAYGLFFTGGWVALFVFVKHWIANTLSFFLLILDYTPSLWDSNNLFTHFHCGAKVANTMLPTEKRLKATFCFS